MHLEQPDMLVKRHEAKVPKTLVTTSPQPELALRNESVLLMSAELQKLTSTLTVQAGSWMKRQLE